MSRVFQMRCAPVKKDRKTNNKSNSELIHELEEKKAELLEKNEVAYPSDLAKKSENENMCFAYGKSSNQRVKELREAKLSYEKKTGYAMTKREIGKRF